MINHQSASRDHRRSEPAAMVHGRWQCQGGCDRGPVAVRPLRFMVPMRVQAWRFSLALIVFLTGVALAARGAPPEIQSVAPAGLVPGREQEIRITGQNLQGATSFWTSFAASEVRALPVEDEGKVARFRMRVPKQPGAGLGALQVYGTNGVSDVHLVLLDALPARPEGTNNHSLAAAQKLTRHTAVDAAFNELTRDYYQFDPRKGERFSLEVVAQRLGSPADPVLRLLDDAGNELAYCDDDPAVGSDPRLQFVAPRSGTFWIEVREQSYQGGPRHRYRLRLGDFPLLTTPFPLAIEPGRKARITFATVTGDSLPGRTIKLPDDQVAGEVPLFVRYRGSRDVAAAQVEASRFPEWLEHEPNDYPEKATTIEVPAGINGRFETSKDKDYFELNVTNGTRLVFRGRTRSLGSPCDLRMKLLRADGSTVGEANIAGTDEGTLTNAFKEPGRYQLLVEELTGAGGPGFTYHIAVEPVVPGFKLNTDADRFQATNGGTVQVKVTCARSGYDGPITLRWAGDTNRVELKDALIPEKKNEINAALRLTDAARPGDLIEGRLWGEAAAGDHRHSAPVSTLPALQKALPQMRYPPSFLDGRIAIGLTQ